MKPFAQRQAIIAVFVSVGFIAPVLWWAMDRAPPYDRISGEVLPLEPMPGDQIQVHWTIKTHKMCGPSAANNVTRQIVDSQKIVWSFDTSPSTFGRLLPVDNPDRIVRIIMLPQSVAPGPATYRSRACFACNPLQYIWPVCVDKPEIPFTIRAAEDAAGVAGPTGPEGPRGHQGEMGVGGRDGPSGPEGPRGPKGEPWMDR